MAIAILLVLLFTVVAFLIVNEVVYLLWRASDQARRSERLRQRIGQYHS